VAADRSDDAADPPAQHAGRPDDADRPSGQNADRSGNADVPSAQQPDRSTGQADRPADHGQQSRRDQIEPRSREEYYLDLRAATESPERSEPAGRSEPGARSKPAEPTENEPQTQAEGTWEETVEDARLIWGDYKRHFREEERPSVDKSSDDPGSWRGEGGRSLDRLKNEQIEAECDRIFQQEKENITPALRAIESQDPHRHLVGLEYNRKGLDRIKEKAYDNMKAFKLSPDEAVALVPDVIRFTFQYEEAQYTQGVWTDTARLREQGFELNIRKNMWSDDQYKGINSQWVEPVSGQRFEVQFHTRISYEAKEITHPAYERIRAEPKPGKLEQMVLEAFQKKVTAEVPIPPGAADIPDYRRGAGAR
jgi:hypothetical protein